MLGQRKVSVDQMRFARRHVILYHQRQLFIVKPLAGGTLEVAEHLDLDRGPAAMPRTPRWSVSQLQCTGNRDYSTSKSTVRVLELFSESTAFTSARYAPGVSFSIMIFSPTGITALPARISLFTLNNPESSFTSWVLRSSTRSCTPTTGAVLSVACGS